MRKIRIVLKVNGSRSGTIESVYIPWVEGLRNGTLVEFLSGGVTNGELIH